MQYIINAPEKINHTVALPASKSISNRALAINYLSDSDTYTEQGRAGYGVRAMRLSEKTGKMIGILAVDQDKDILIAQPIET